MRIPVFSVAVVLAWSLIPKSGGAEIGKPISLLNGKDLSGWKVVGARTATNQWQIGTASLDPADPAKLVSKPGGTDLVSPVKGVNLATEREFGDCALELEFMMSKNSNAGVKMMNIYEIQMLDSFGKEQVTDSDCGAIYRESAPKVNACRKPGEWQQLIIEFRAPRFDAAGTKTANAKFVKVTLNGQLIQENFEIAHGTNVGRNVKERALAPVYLQGDHGPVAFRNMFLTPR
jgi:hypothetical protein